MSLIALIALLIGVTVYLTISALGATPAMQPIAGVELRFANTAVLLALDDCQSDANFAVQCSRSLNGQSLEVKLQPGDPSAPQWSLGFGPGTPNACQALFNGKSVVCTSTVPKADAAIFVVVSASDLGVQETLAGQLHRQNLFFNFKEAEWSGLAALISSLLGVSVAALAYGLLAQLGRGWRVAATLATFIVATSLSMSAWLALLLRVKLMD